MNTRNEIVELLSVAMLRDVVDAYELTCEDRRKAEALRAAVSRSELELEQILEGLRADDLKSVARQLELRASGRREDVEQRILSSVALPEGQQKPSYTAVRAAEQRISGKTKETIHGSSVNLAVFRFWLEEELNTGRLQEGEIKFGYCPACSRRHPQKWFLYEGSLRGVYLCYTEEPRLVDSRAEGSKFTVHELSDYVKDNTRDPRLLEEVHRAERKMNATAQSAQLGHGADVAVRLEALAVRASERPFWTRILGFGRQSGSHVARHIRVGDITTTPPFIELKISASDLSAAWQKGRDAWRS